MTALIKIRVQGEYLQNKNGKIRENDTLAATVRDIVLPFNIENDTLRGTLFIEKPWTYPYPVLPKLAIPKKKDLP